MFVGDEDVKGFSVLGTFGVFNVDLDFRKRLLIVTHLYSLLGMPPFHTWLWGCRCRSKRYVGTSIYWISLTEFDVNKFKLVNASH